MEFDNILVTANGVSSIQVVAADSDGGSLWDDWEMENFQSLTAANADTDSDSDGIRDSLEMLAGTDPSEAESFLNLLLNRGEQGMALQWNGVAGRKYRVLQADSITGPFTEIDANIKPEAPNTYLLPEGEDGVKFYRVLVEMDGVEF